MKILAICCFLAGFTGCLTPSTPSDTPRTIQTLPRASYEIRWQPPVYQPGRWIMVPIQ